MKAVLIGWMLAATLAPAEMLTQGERDRAMSSLHATRKLFLDSIADVSPEQWVFKPAPEVWSIAEVAEHIVLSENLIKGASKSAVKMGKPATAPKVKDEFILEVVVDRSKKAQAPEALKPTNQWKSKDEIIAEFKKRRDDTIEYVKTTEDDLRANVLPHPALGPLDGYQWVLLLSSHSERHTMQLNEVKTKPGYPRK